MTTAPNKPQLESLIEQAKSHLLTMLTDGGWHLVEELHSCIPDDLADARLAQTSPVVYQDQADPREYGRYRLVQEAVDVLAAEDQIERRTPFGSQEEVRLVPAAALDGKNLPVKPAPASSVSASEIPASPAVPVPVVKSAAATAPLVPLPEVKSTAPTITNTPPAQVATAPVPSTTETPKPPVSLSVPIDQIRVGPRHRKQLGDIAALARSIQEVGLLHPLPVTPDHQLIAGERRLAALRQLGWKEVPVTIASNLDDAVQLLQAERDENQCRKSFEPSEAVALGRAIEALERPQAQERQCEHGGTAPGRKKNTSGKLPGVSSGGRTRDKVALAVGMSGRTYEKTKAVVEAAEENPERYRPLVERMDKTGKVDPAYRQVKRHTGSKPKNPAAKSDVNTPHPPSGKQAGAEAASQAETLTITKPATPAQRKDLARKLQAFLGDAACRELAHDWTQATPQPKATKPVLLRNPEPARSKRGRQSPMYCDSMMM